MSQRTNYPPLGSPNQNGEVTLTGNFKLGSSGAIASQTSTLESGFTVTHDTTSSAVGRYLATFDSTYKALKTKQVSVTGPAAGSAFPTTTGILPFFRDYTGTAATSVAASIQLVRPDTMADADGASGTVVHLTFVLEQ